MWIWLEKVAYVYSDAIYKTRKKRICFVSRLDETLVLWHSKNFMKIRLTEWVDLSMDWPIGLTFFFDRRGWPFFGLTEQVELFIGWHFYGLTERVDLFCVGKIGLTFFWVDYENYSTVIYLLNLIPSLQYHATPQSYLRVVYWVAKSLWHFLINLKKFIISFPTVCSNF